MSWIERTQNQRNREIEEAKARKAQSELEAEQKRREQEEQKKQEKETLIKNLRNNIEFLAPERLLEDINQAYWDGEGVIVEVGEVESEWSHPRTGSMDNTISLGQSYYLGEKAYGGYSLVRFYPGVEYMTEIDPETDSQEYTREYDVTYYDSISIGYTNNDKFYVSYGTQSNYYPSNGVSGGPGSEFNYEDKGKVLEEVQRKLVNVAEKIKAKE